MFNIVPKSWSLSFSGGSIAIASPSLNFCMQPWLVIQCVSIAYDTMYSSVSIACDTMYSSVSIACDTMYSSVSIACNTMCVYCLYYNVQ